MADRGHELTEEMLSELEARIAEEYEKAAREMAKKYREYRKAWRDEDKVMRARLKAGEITQKEYADWCYRKTMNGKQWEQLRDALAEDMVRTDQMARALAAQQMPDVFALNGNFATYQVEHGGHLDTGFTLYDRDTAMYLMRDQQLMPGPSSTLAAKISANKDLQWNKRHIQSAVLQGIMQGESPLKVAARLAGVAQMDYNAAVRYARTMTTDAQNAGRYEGYRRAKKIGVDLKIEWSATLDGRTRHEHRMLDGQRRDVDEPFIVDGVKIMWPAQSSGPGSSDIPQSLIWNCRCTLNAWVKGFEPGQVTSSTKMGGMSYDEWKHAKEPKNKPEPKQETPQFVSRFKPAESIKEAEEFAMNFCDPKKQFGAVGIDYTGVELDVANRINHVLVDLYDEFDVKPFGGVIAPAGNTKLGKMLSGANAAYSPVQHSFLLNRKTFGKVKNAEKTFAESRSLIKDILEHPEKYDISKASYTARKVIGAAKISGRDVVPDTIESAIYHEFGHSLERNLRKLDNYNTIYNNMGDYAPKLSGYATTEFSEYVAESFASWRLGEGLVDPEIVKAFEMLRRKR